MGQSIHSALAGLERTKAIAQLNRWYNRLMSNLGYGGHFGWDIPTMRAVHPGIYNSYKRLCDMARPYRVRVPE